MKQFRDREYNRLMNNADDLLSNLTVYETPAEEEARKQEEAVRLKAEEEKRMQEQTLMEAETMEQEDEPEEAKDVEQKPKLTEAEALEQEDELAGMETVERELEEAETLVREIQLKEAELMKPEWKEQAAIADDLEMEWQQGQEFSTEETTLTFMKREDSLFVCSLFSILCFMYMEVITHLGIYGSIDTKIVYPLLFAAGIGCMAAVVSSFFSKRWNTVLFCVLLILCNLYCDLQMIYHSVWGAFLSLTDIPAGIQMLSQQGKTVIPGMTVVLPWLVLMFLPILLWAVAGRKWVRFEQSRWWSRLLMTAAGIIVVTIGILCLDLHGYEADSPYVCFYHFDSEAQLEETGRQLGITASAGLELLEWFRK